MSEQLQQEEDYLAYYRLAAELFTKRVDAESIVLALRKYAKENFDYERYKVSCFWVFGRDQLNSIGGGRSATEGVNLFVNAFIDSFDCEAAMEKFSPQLKEREKTIIMLYAAIQIIKLNPTVEKKIKTRAIRSRIFLFIFCSILFVGGTIANIALAHGGAIWLLLVMIPIFGIYGMYKSVSEIIKMHGKINKLTK
ncbi:MAG: hypothetical protein ACHQHP_06880 [Bacteroidia bacterium]